MRFGYLSYRRDLASVEVRELMNDVRQAEENRFLNEGCLSVPQRVLDIGAESRGAVEQELGTVKSRDLVPDDAGDGIAAVPTDRTTSRRL